MITHMNNKITMKLDLELLKEVLSISAPSEQEEDAIMYVTKWVKKNIPKAKVKADKYGNLYVTKGKAEFYPTFVGHLDDVHSYYPNKKILELDDWLYAMNPDDGQQIGTAGDDKVGMYLCLESLRTYDNVKAFFPVEEELGTIGTGQCDMSFFDDSQYVIQSDRRGNEDIVVSSYSTKMTSKVFNKVAAAVGKPYGYKLCHSGGLTDVITLKQQGLNVCSINIASGYYQPHTSSETVSISDVSDMVAIVSDLVDELGDKVWKHKYKKADYSKQYKSWGNDYYNQVRTWNKGSESSYYDKKSSFSTDSSTKYSKTVKHGTIATDVDGVDWRYDWDTMDWVKVHSETDDKMMCMDCMTYSSKLTDYDGYTICDKCNEWYNNEGMSDGI